MLLLDQNDLVVYQGRKIVAPEEPQENDENGVAPNANVMIQRGVQSALETLVQSSSGRVALPTTSEPPHRATQVLAGRSYSTSLPKSMVLQRISDSMCWMVLSEQQRIEAFTTYDWKWLGQLAQYVRPS